MLQLTMTMSICYHLHFGYAIARNVITLEGLLQALLKNSITLLRSTRTLQTVQTNVQQLPRTGVPVCYTIGFLPGESELKSSEKSSMDLQGNMEEHHSIWLGQPTGCGCDLIGLSLPYGAKVFSGVRGERTLYGLDLGRFFQEPVDLIL